MRLCSYQSVYTLACYAIEQETYTQIRGWLQKYYLNLNNPLFSNDDIKRQQTASAIISYLIVNGLIEDRQGFLRSFNQCIEDLPELSVELTSTLNELRAIDLESLDFDTLDENDQRLRCVKTIHKKILDLTESYRKKIADVEKIVDCNNIATKAQTESSETENFKLFYPEQFSRAILFLPTAS